MTLDEYLTDHRLSETVFGTEVGLSQSQVNRIRRGKSWPPKEVMERIRLITGGKVSPNDFLEDQP